MSELELYPHIFITPTAKPSNDPNDFFPAPHPVADAFTGGQILSFILDGPFRQHVHPSLFAKLDGRRLHHMWLAIALLPYRDGLLKEKKKDITMAEVVIRDGIKVRHPLRLSRFLRHLWLSECPQTT
jgi:hypothetical protein